ncbi:thymidylate kinase [Pyrrhoderma noxium]|uniref:dTMP kinase n=1 Tax=Pyrrhoderma noxium TaxID=2282107 RepID=A0A286UJZ7_9AGAM|nr:thymidylate kinase [Pyrrhoderma noxium]
MSTALKRGLFIVVEGLDRSGKSTQALALQKALQLANIQSELIRFPDRTTPTGKVIDGYLTKKYDMDVRAIHLLFSANRWESASKIEQMLSSGISVISDRYAFSGVVYTAAKGIPLTWCKQPDVGLPAPDLTLFLDISPEVAALRGAMGKNAMRKRDFKNE